MTTKERLQNAIAAALACFKWQSKENIKDIRWDSATVTIEFFDGDIYYYY